MLEAKDASLPDKDDAPRPKLVVKAETARVMLEFRLGVTGGSGIDITWAESAGRACGCLRADRARAFDAEETRRAPVVKPRREGSKVTSGTSSMAPGRTTRGSRFTSSAEAAAGGAA